MSRKDYVKVAEVIAAGMTCAKTDDTRQTVHVIATCIGEVFAADNPRFDRERFMAACGVTS